MDQGAPLPLAAPGSPQAHAHASTLWRAAARHALRVRKAEEAAQSWVALDTPSERCIRHDYDAVTGTWSKSETRCMIERTHFAEGAMRKCYRLLKETQAPNATQEYRNDWHHAGAYVAKAYKDEAVGTREMYERDCKMQQEAKLWGARYDALRPPKPVDFLQCFLLELVDRPGAPIFACERVITGEYIKHNSNSGYVESHRRATPQAFSHFTFQASRGRLIIVDIQGVADLYTDPQVHTLEGTGYGEGNLGANGFALFFSGHRCSPLCAKLGLVPLPKSETELFRDDRAASAVALASETSGAHSSSSGSSATVQVRTWRSADAALMPETTGKDEHGVAAALRAARCALTASVGTHAARESARRTWAAREAARWITVVPLEALPAWALEARSWALEELPVAAEHRAALLRRLSVGALARQRPPADGLIATHEVWLMFAPVHLALARYCACGGLPVLDGVPDEPSAVFHVCFAARGGNSDALRAWRDLARGVVQDLVPGVQLGRELPDVARALTAVLAHDGDLAACVELADAAANADEKLSWLDRALAAFDGADGVPLVGLERHALLEKAGRARLAAGDASGAAEAFSEASEAALALGKGKLSVKLASLAEEAQARADGAGD